MIEGFCTSQPKHDQWIKALCDTVHTNSLKTIPRFSKGEWKTFDWKKWTKNPVAVVGTLRGAEEVIWECQKRLHPFYYMDHAYFGATRNYEPGPNGMLYRLIKNQMQLNYTLELEKEDLKRIKKYKPIDRKPFTKSGEHIILCPPTEAITRLYKIENEKVWTENKITEIKKYTDRKVIVRNKTTKIPLEDQLKNAYCMVSYQSTAAIQAILNGVPSFCSEVSAARELSELELENIDSPHYPDDDLVNQWIEGLLACQFSMEEIKSGEAVSIVDRLQQ